jgi:hypothetical protein
MLLYSVMPVLMQIQGKFVYSQVTGGMGSDGFTDVTVKIMRHYKRKFFLKACKCVHQYTIEINQPTYLLHGAESFLRSQPVNFAASQEIPRIYGTRKFLAVPTSARHLTLS